MRVSEARPWKLSEGDEQADDGTKEGNTLHKCSCDDHVGAEITSHFRLTSHGLQRGATNASNTEARTYCCSACSEASYALSNFKKDGQQFHLTIFENV
jgi:hypothetical protein